MNQRTRFVLAFLLILTAVTATVFLGSCQGTDVQGSAENHTTEETDQSSDITMAKIVHANSTAELLKHYDSFHITYINGSDYAFEYYADDDILFEMDNTYYAVYTGTDCIYWDNGGYGRVLYAGIEPDKEWFRWLVLDDYMALWETVVNTTMKNDKIYVNTSLPSQYIDDLYGEDEGITSVLMAYVLDAKTYAILESTATFRYTDGYCGTMQSRMEINADRPSRADELISHMNDTKDTRTFTIILDPGTSKETSYSLTVSKEDYVNFYYPYEYSDPYLDPACTQLVTQEDLDTDRDLTVYIKTLYPEAETAGSL